MADEEGEDPPIFHRLPNELLFDIFSRFPAKSLCRLRCVCSRWSSVLIDNHDFKLLNFYVAPNFKSISSVALGYSAITGEFKLLHFYAVDGRRAPEKELPAREIDRRRGREPNWGIGGWQYSLEGLDVGEVDQRVVVEEKANRGSSSPIPSILLLLGEEKSPSHPAPSPFSHPSHPGEGGREVARAPPGSGENAKKKLYFFCNF